LDQADATPDDHLVADGQEAKGAPCGTCSACQKVAAGIHPDVRLLNLTVQPGERRTLGIQTIRELRRGIAERPFAGQRKVYIIEDAETMTPEAANALLKTLEEPPPFVVLLIVAISDHLLLPTIVSRCQVLPLRIVPRQEVRQALLEQWNASPEQADLLAALSYGRPGWAIQALQTDSVLPKRTENLDKLRQMLEAGLLERFTFAEKQQQRWRRGKYSDVIDLLECWQGWWRDLQLIGQGCPDLVVNIDHLEGLRTIAQRVPQGGVLGFLRALGAARQQLKDQVNPRLVFENLLMQMPTVV
jgi:DNA polymerase-3 subunit delta'